VSLILFYFPKKSVAGPKPLCIPWHNVTVIKVAATEKRRKKEGCSSSFLFASLDLNLFISIPLFWNNVNENITGNV
jgi:hypothetical protein